MLSYLFLAFVFQHSGCFQITSIETSLWQGYVFVRVGSSTGEYGWGQSTYPTLNDATLGNLSTIVAGKIHEWISPVALGRNISKIEDILKISEDAWDSNYKNTGTVLTQSICGVDTAIWDLFAKSCNRSVCELLGPCFSNIKIYASNLNRSLSPDFIVTRAEMLKQNLGVEAFKFKIGTRMGHNVDVYPNRSQELISLARSRLGKDATLMVDANGGYDDLQHISPIVSLLKENDYTWLEEPFHFWRYSEMEELNIKTGMPLALGEQEYRLDVWERVIDSMRFAQPDVHYIGGFSRILRVAELTLQSHKTLFVPHSPNPSYINVFVLHLMGSLPSAYEFMEFDALDTTPPTGTHLFTTPVFQIENGAIKVPTEPGWGVSLKPNLLSNAINQTSRM